MTGRRHSSLFCRSAAAMVWPVANGSGFAGELSYGSEGGAPVLPVGETGFGD